MSPLDGVITDYVLPAEVVPDLTKPSLEALAYVLRHEGARRVPWRWDFSSFSDAVDTECGTAGCAGGLAAAMWLGVHESGEELVHFMSRIFGITYVHAEQLFVEGFTRNSGLVTPAVVAARIDDYLAGRRIRYLVEGDRS